MRNLPKEYETYLSVLGRSDKTIKTYTTAVSSFYNYLEKINKQTSVKDLTSADLINYFAQNLSNLSASSKNTHLFALRNFFNFLYLTGEIQNNPTLQLQSFKSPFREPQKLDNIQLSIVLDALKGTRNYIRDRSIILTAAICCLRVSEITGINIDDINNNTLRIIGKGNKERFVPLSPLVSQAINDYLDSRPVSSSPALYISTKTNDRLSTRSVQHLIETLSKKTGIDFHTHTLRHTGASYIYDATKDIVITQEILGHTNISTTRRYIHTNEELKSQAIMSSALNNLGQN